jgi:preprotein translocase subunit YajC
LLIVTVSALGVIGWYFMARAERKRNREMQMAAKQ